MKTSASLKFISFIALSLFLLSGCVSTHQAMREPNSRVDFTSKDFTFSEQQTGEAKVTQVFGIDWKRLFKSEEGELTKDQDAAGFSLASIPVIGTVVSPTDKAYNYALYKLMQANPGYDAVFYPQYEKTEKRPIIIPIVKITTIKVKARLAKIKTN